MSLLFRREPMIPMTKACYERWGILTGNSPGSPDGHSGPASLPVSMSQFQLKGDWETAHRTRVFVEFSQILIQDINIFKMWHKI